MALAGSVLSGRWIAGLSYMVEVGEAILPPYYSRASGATYKAVSGALPYM